MEAPRATRDASGTSSPPTKYQRKPSMTTAISCHGLCRRRNSRSSIRMASRPPHGHEQLLERDRAVGDERGAKGLDPRERRLMDIEQYPPPVAVALLHVYARTSIQL